MKGTDVRDVVLAVRSLSGHLLFIGRPIGDESVLQGSFEAGVLTRWIFSEIASDAFS